MSVRRMKWQLPVKQSNTTDHDWVHPRAKYHAFAGRNAICGRHSQRTDYFETDMPENADVKLKCRTCVKLVEKIRVGEETEQ